MRHLPFGLWLNNNNKTSTIPAGCLISIWNHKVRQVRNVLFYTCTYPRARAVQQTICTFILFFHDFISMDISSILSSSVCIPGWNRGICSMSGRNTEVCGACLKTYNLDNSLYWHMYSHEYSAVKYFSYLRTAQLSPSSAVPPPLGNLFKPETLLFEALLGWISCETKKIRQKNGPLNRTRSLFCYSSVELACLFWSGFHEHMNEKWILS